MSDKAVGIIGQKYEDRKTGKCGVLVSRDEKYMTLDFEGDDGKHFKISNSSFRSNWRKVKDEVAETEPVSNKETESVTPEVSAEEPLKKVEPVTKKTKSNFDEVSIEDAIANLVKIVESERKVEVFNEADCLSIFADDVLVIRIRTNGDDTFNLAMLPDIFTLTDWRGLVNTKSIQYKTGAEHYLGVELDTKETSIPELLDILAENVKDINVYGYSTEEDTEDGEN